MTSLEDSWFDIFMNNDKSYGLSSRINDIKVLIDAGVDVNTKGFEGKTALMMECYFYKQDITEHIAEMLITAGADVNAKDKFGETVLELVANTGVHIRSPDNLFTLLINAGVKGAGNLNSSRFPQFKLYLYRKEIEKLKQQLETVTKERDLLQAKLDYQPYGPGYDETEKHFNELSK